MLTTHGDAKSALASEVWTRMFKFFMRTVPHRQKALTALGLTPNDSKTLSCLDLVVGKKMSELAEQWGTDASNVTWVIDRLEKRGLVERRTMESDRRVKAIVLTPRGSKTRAELLRAFHQVPPELLVLEPEDLEALLRILTKLQPEEPLSHNEGPGSHKRGATNRRPA